MAAYEKDQGRTLYEKLIDLYVEYGFYKENLISLTRKGINGQKEIAEMMAAYRSHPPAAINGSPVIQLSRLRDAYRQELKHRETWEIDLPKSNVLQFILQDGSKISARPSGTEPKIKFYFSVHTQLPAFADYDRVNAELTIRIDRIIADLQLK